MHTKISIDKLDDFFKLTCWTKYATLTGNLFLYVPLSSVLCSYCMISSSPASYQPRFLTDRILHLKEHFTPKWKFCHDLHTHMTLFYRGRRKAEALTSPVPIHFYCIFIMKVNGDWPTSVIKHFWDPQKNNRFSIVYKDIYKDQKLLVYWESRINVTNVKLYSMYQNSRGRYR